MAELIYFPLFRVCVCVRVCMQPVWKLPAEKSTSQPTVLFEFPPPWHGT